MFNTYVWDMYLNAGGYRIAELFENSIKEGFNKDYRACIAKLHTDYCPSPVITKQIRVQLVQLNEDMKQEEYPASCYYAFVDLKKDTEYSIDELVGKLYDGFKKDEPCTDRQVFELFSSDIAYYSTLLYWLFPELFVPYYYECNYNILSTIADEFGILLPEIPVKKDYRGRFLYYAELCKAFYDFRDEFDLSPYEFCAFLYDFAPKYVGALIAILLKICHLLKTPILSVEQKMTCFCRMMKDWLLHGNVILKHWWGITL